LVRSFGNQRQIADLALKNEKIKTKQRFGSAQFGKYVRLNHLTTPCGRPLAVIG